MQVALGHQLRITLVCKVPVDLVSQCVQKTGEVLTLENFRAEDTEQISAYFSTHGFPAAIVRAPIDVSGAHVCDVCSWCDVCAGVSWGDYDFDGPTLSFIVGGKIAFELPLGAVTNANFQKNEAIVEFQEAMADKESQVIESARFLITENEEVCGGGGLFFVLVVS